MRVIKFLAFVVLLTSQCLAADPVLKYYSSKRNIFGGQDYYYKGQFLFRSTPNVLGGENLSKGSSLEYQSRPNIHGGTTLIVPPTKRDSFSSKPTPKPAPYYNLDRYKSNEVKSSSYERYKQSLPKSRFDSQRTEWGKARVPSNPYKSSKK